MSRQWATDRAPASLTDVGVVSLRQAIESSLDGSLAAISLDQCRIFVTRAFVETVGDSQGAHLADLSEFMRPPDALVVFPSTEVLLLSEWEADQVLPLLWKCGGIPAFLRAHQPFVANLAYLREAADLKWPSSQVWLQVPAASTVSPMLHDLTVAGLQLLAGETMFATETRKQSVRKLTAQTAASRKAALRLVALRGRQHMISRSDLELICNVDIGEA